MLLPLQIELQARLLPCAHTPSSGALTVFPDRRRKSWRGGICSSLWCPRIPVEPQWRENLDLLLTTSSLQAQGRAGRPFIGHLVAEHTGRLHTMSRGSLTFHCLHFLHGPSFDRTVLSPLSVPEAEGTGTADSAATKPDGILCPMEFAVRRGAQRESGKDTNGRASLQ